MKLYIREPQSLTQVITISYNAITAVGSDILLKTLVGCHRNLLRVLFQFKLIICFLGLQIYTEGSVNRDTSSQDTKIVILNNCQHIAILKYNKICNNDDFVKIAGILALVFKKETTEKANYPFFLFEIEGQDEEKTHHVFLFFKRQPYSLVLP